jgi:hypothetical protein
VELELLEYRIEARLDFAIDGVEALGDITFAVLRHEVGEGAGVELASGDAERLRELVSSFEKIIRE